MKTSEFSFELPENLIAQYPPEKRGQSRLLVMDRKNGCFEHRMVKDLPSILDPGTLLVFNNSRVRRARLFGVSTASGTNAEFFLLKKLDDLSWQAMAKRSGRKRPGSIYVFDDIKGEIVSATDAEAGKGLSPGAEAEKGVLVLRFEKPIDDAWLDIHGHVPLPPYIRRGDVCEDRERYQTVFAAEYGSAAAPTAGLHFTGELLKELEMAGIETAFITLHVGPGTFLPVRTEDLEKHKMHEEAYSIGDETADRIEKAKAGGRKVIAIGTTSVRTMESAWMEEEGILRRGEGNTSIFIYPGYIFKVTDAIFTNFHTPLSTLLMLVSAFAGRDFIMECYKEAVRAGYRFYSYGDACLIL